MLIALTTVVLQPAQKRRVCCERGKSRRLSCAHGGSSHPPAQLGMPAVQHMPQLLPLLCFCSPHSSLRGDSLRRDNSTESSASTAQIYKATAPPQHGRLSPLALSRFNFPQLCWRGNAPPASSQRTGSYIRAAPCGCAAGQETEPPCYRQQRERREAVCREAGCV